MSATIYTGDVDVWIRAYGPEAAKARRLLVEWLDDAADVIPADRPELVVSSLAEMAAMIGVACPDKRERLAELLYMAADTVATVGPAASHDALGTDQYRRNGRRCCGSGGRSGRRVPGGDIAMNDKPGIDSGLAGLCIAAASGFVMGVVVGAFFW